MATRITLLSDTHLPKRAKDLPAALWTAIEESDVVVHAGDWVDLATLDLIAARSRRLVAVRGNNDGPEFDERLPLEAGTVLDGVQFAVVHETGPATGREARMAERYPDTDVLVFGHSHIPWDTVADTGLRLVNPGSPTDRRRQPFCTWMTAVADAGVFTVELHRVPRS
ncbi:metallophosphoesterase family protein [Curtobacterium sp. Leaf261]|uniref:metallophosphoesterase family protein n=1 Tax=Curtobacterium sp. Leaf261 TaxID=1736311 RepID=UPI0007005468|nr:YfcE family phosphodiesterase [Curtobacterium sp. Leaf261]KQO65103.1 phosphodiesterase [Curtobacterium sp. Leaf261]